jgi:hypothetical protein
MTEQPQAGGRGWNRWLTTATVGAGLLAVGLVSCALVSEDEGRTGALIAPTPSSTRGPTGTPGPLGTPGPTGTPGPPGTPGTPGTPSPTPGCGVTDLLVPKCGVWFGAAANPIGNESWDEALPAFEKVIGQPVDIAHYYNSSPGLFPSANMIKRAREPGKKRILLLNWKPEMGRTWAQVAAGDPVVDAAIDAEASYLKTSFPEKFFLTIHHEPEEEVRPAEGSGMTAKDYRAMFRHVVERLRSNGVTNAVYVMNYMGTPHWGSQPWFDDLYPGDDVVDWIAEDPYIFSDNPEWSSGLGRAVNRTQRIYPNWPGFYTWATAKHPDKPIMLAEWGVDRKLGEPKRSAVFGTMASQLAAYPQLKALVYWNETEFRTVGETLLAPDDPSVATLRKAIDTPPLKPPAVPKK